MSMTGMHIQMRRRISSPNGRQKHERNMETDTDIFNLDEEPIGAVLSMWLSTADLFVMTT